MGEDIVAIFAGVWQAKQVSCSALSPRFPSLKSANPQPPVAAYFLESLTMFPALHQFAGFACLFGFSPFISLSSSGVI